MTTPTPETDNHARVYETAGMPAAYRVLLDLSRKLELKRDEAIAELEEYRSIAESIGATKAVSERDKALDLSRKLELQRDEANNTSRTMVRLHDEQEKEIEQLCEERDELRKAADALAQSEDCPNCANNGWYMNGSTDDSHQVQCQWCETVSNSRFNALILYSQLPHVKKENKSK